MYIHIITQLRFTVKMYLEYYSNYSIHKQRGVLGGKTGRAGDGAEPNGISYNFEDAFNAYDFSTLFQCGTRLVSANDPAKKRAFRFSIKIKTFSP
jgi:hypothetical protein